MFAGTPYALIFSEFANQSARGKWNLWVTIVTISFSEYSAIFINESKVVFPLLSRINFDLSIPRDKARSLMDSGSLKFCGLTDPLKTSAVVLFWIQ